MSGSLRRGRKPDFIVPGEMRCGTTTLWSLLSQHPKVFSPEHKELHFFSSYNPLLRDGSLDEAARADYFRRFAEARADQVCGEATPTYLFDAGACARMATLLPDLRLVVMLRDPVARAWSHYWHQVRRGRETLGFEEALAAEEERVRTGDARRRAWFSYRLRGRYVEHLERYERAFSREQILVIFLEELRRDPAAVLARVWEHLGLAAPEAPLRAETPHANRADFPRWPRLDARTRALRAWADRRGPAGLVRAIELLGRATRSLRVYSGAPRMSESARRDLRRSFAESDRRLADWLGRPPPWMTSPT